MPDINAPPHVLSLLHAIDVQVLMREILEHNGFRVTTQAHDVDDLGTIADIAPDVLIVDLTSSTIVDDWSLLLRLALDGRTARIPVVLCTAAVREAEVLSEPLRNMGIVVVPEPFDGEELLSALDRGLHRGPVQPSIEPR